MGVQQQIQMSHTEKCLQLSSQIQLLNFGYCIKYVGDRFMDGNRIASVVYKECTQYIDYDTSYIVLPLLALSRV